MPLSSFEYSPGDFVRMCMFDDSTQGQPKKKYEYPYLDMDAEVASSYIGSYFLILSRFRYHEVMQNNNEGAIKTNMYLVLSSQTAQKFLLHEHELERVK